MLFLTSSSVRMRVAELLRGVVAEDDGDGLAVTEERLLSVLALVAELTRELASFLVIVSGHRGHRDLVLILRARRETVKAQSRHA